MVGRTRKRFYAREDCRHCNPHASAHWEASYRVEGGGFMIHSTAVRQLWASAESRTRTYPTRSTNLLALLWGKIVSMHLRMRQRWLAE
jgi:hypothetical protein